MFDKCPKFLIGGVRFSALSLAQATSAVIEAAKGRNNVAVHLWNTYCVGLHASSPTYRTCVTNNSIFLADGKPVATLLRLKASPLAAGNMHIRGSDLFREVLLASQGEGLRHGFYGSTPQILDLLKARIAKDYPSLDVADFCAPPFGPVDEKLISSIVHRIKTNSVDIVWLGFGTPKQDLIATRIAESLPVIAIGVGAAFDFLAGSQPEAPGWAVRLGLEWFYRLITEPRRLWQRYTIGTFWFLLSLTGWKR